MFDVLDMQRRSTLPVSDDADVGDTIYTPQLSRVPPTREVVISGDSLAHARQTFENLRVVLKTVGGSLLNVLQMPVLLTDGLGVNSVYKEYFCAPYTSRSTVVANASRVLHVLVAIGSMRTWARNRMSQGRLSQ